MSITVKPGVVFAVVAPAGFVILQALKTVSAGVAVDLTITSATDGAHAGPTDPHKLGEAYDVRSHDFDAETKGRVLAAIIAALGRDRFFAFLEAPGTPHEHFHLQRKKGTTFTIEDWLSL